MNKRLTCVVLALSALSFNAAWAHGEAKARHGGVVAKANDLNFELVGTPAGAAIYIDDHGKPLAPTGMTGKLTVLKGTEKSEAELVVAGDRLEAKGVKLPPGAKAVAALTTPAKKALTVRFTIK
ncbi:hypothetical protein [Rubrivivax rivuli]|uniref:Uncharacterized protein n=1 Tax=Rubrivivax rivuli TaxID=1862385 RepID=A0A437RAX2_9BURK|nr:hypothetical protein [Rubrivivax rivuli]RVU43875.1 hypothetical protein EOE66_19660 [Rubrivivax rivuli]